MTEFVYGEQLIDKKSGIITQDRLVELIREGQVTAYADGERRVVVVDPQPGTEDEILFRQMEVRRMAAARGQNEVPSPDLTNSDYDIIARHILKLGDIDKVNKLYSSETQIDQYARAAAPFILDEKDVPIELKVKDGQITENNIDDPKLFFIHIDDLLDNIGNFYFEMDKVLRHEKRRLDPPENVFKMEGPTWTITFQGRTLTGLKSKGFSILHHLVSHPKQIFSNRELLDVIYKPDHDGLTSNKQRDDSLSYDSDPFEARQEILDRPAINEYRKRLSDIDHDLDKANERNDTGGGGGGGQVEKLLSEKEKLDHYIKKFTLAGGRLKKFRTELDKVKDRIGKQKKRALTELAKYDQNIWRHFKDAIGPAHSDSHKYDPGEPISWVTE